MIAMSIVIVFLTLVLANIFIAVVSDVYAECEENSSREFALQTDGLAMQESGIVDIDAKYHHARGTIFVSAAFQLKISPTDAGKDVSGETRQETMENFANHSAQLRDVQKIGCQ